MSARPALTLFAALAAIAAPAQQAPGLEERVTVTHVLVDLRAVDPGGDPIPGLGIENFRVRVDGKRVEVASVDEFGGPDQGKEARGVPTRAERVDAGRRIVLFFQRDLDPSRMVGLMRMREEAGRFIDRLTPRDRVAIFAHDFKLECYTDFTADRRRLREIVDDSIVRYRPPGEPVVEGRPELLAHYDSEAAGRAANPERALEVIADALRPIAGPKSLIFLGWGLGRYDNGTVAMRTGYERTRQALTGARTAIFALDVTEADFHTLELPLTQAALETGGFYVKTIDDPAGAMRQVERALSARYVLAFARPDDRRGSHRVRIELVDRAGVVYYPDSYRD